MTHRHRAITSVTLVLLAAMTVGLAAGLRERSARADVRALTDRGNRLLQEGRYHEAEPVLRQAVAIADRRLDAHDLQTAAALNQLGMADKYLARFDEGSANYHRALDIAQHSDTAQHDAPAPALLLANLYHNLGGLEHARRRFADGEPFARRAVAIRLQALGEDDPAVAADRVALAAILDGQWQYAEAEPLYVSAISAFDRAGMGADPDLAVALNNLAALYQAQGRLDRAEPLYVRALAMKELLLPPGHPDIANTANNLAALYRRAGRYLEAAALYERALTIFDRAFGPDHPSTIACRANYDRLLKEMHFKG